MVVLDADRGGGAGWRRRRAGRRIDQTGATARRHVGAGRIQGELMKKYVLLALVLATGCKGRTEIMVGVATDLRATGQIDKVQMRILREGVTFRDVSWDLMP